MVLSYAYCNVSVAPIHRDPAHRSEQTSQLLFGEKAEVLEIEGHDWARIRTRWDDYEGWVKASQLQFIQPKEYRKLTKQISTQQHSQIMFEEGCLWMPAGSELTGLKHGKVLCGDKPGKFKGKKQSLDKLLPTPDAVVEAAKTFLHAPYQWGGRTIAGIDCSGLVQMAYKLSGHSILRDASQQATVGQTLDFLTEGRAADLAFFDNDATIVQPIYNNAAGSIRCVNDGLMI